MTRALTVEDSTQICPQYIGDSLNWESHSYQYKGTTQGFEHCSNALNPGWADKESMRVVTPYVTPPNSTK